MAALFSRNVIAFPKAPALFGLRRGAVTSTSCMPPMANLTWRRQIRTEPTKPTTMPMEIITPESGQEKLANQRLRRPVAPNLAIYKWQVHSVSSAMERNTGILLAGGLYLLGGSYLIAPLFGWQLSSAALAAAFGAMPIAAKVALKFTFAWTFTFHFFNGMRYIATSTGRTVASKTQVIRIAWAVIGSSALAAVGLVAYV